MHISTKPVVLLLPALCWLPPLEAHLHQSRGVLKVQLCYTQSALQRDTEVPHRPCMLGC